MRSTTRRPASVLTAFAVITATVLAACGGTTASAAPSTAAPAPSAGAQLRRARAEHEPVTIVVGALRPGVTQEAVDALYEQIGQFEAKYPWITVEPEEYNWTAPTFTAALAAGTLPDVFTIPFTDGKGLIAQHQIVDIDARVRALRLRGQVQPERARQRPGRRRQDLRRADRGVRHVADLQPDPVHPGRPRPERAAGDVGRGPRRGQDHRREDRRRRLRLDGHREHRRLAADHLDVRAWAAGCRRSPLTARSPRPSTTTQTKAVLERLKAMRWEDNSMGATFDYAWGTINQAFAAGQVGMFTGGSDLYTWMIQNASLNPDDYGVSIIPLEGAPNAGVLGGGTLAAVNVVTTEAERDAAVAWIDFYYIQKLLTEEGAVADAEGPHGQQPARRRAGPADLRQGHVRRVPGLDQGLHQRPGRRR